MKDAVLKMVEETLDEAIDMNFNIASTRVKKALFSFIGMTAADLTQQ